MVRGNWQRRVEIIHERRRENKVRRARKVDRSIHRSMAVGLISYLDGYCKDSNSNSGNSRCNDSNNVLSLWIDCPPKITQVAEQRVTTVVECNEDRNDENNSNNNINSEQNSNNNNIAIDVVDDYEEQDNVDRGRTGHKKKGRRRRKERNIERLNNNDDNNNTTNDKATFVRAPGQKKKAHPRCHLPSSSAAAESSTSLSSSRTHICRCHFFNGKCRINSSNNNSNGNNDDRSNCIFHHVPKGESLAEYVTMFEKVSSLLSSSSSSTILTKKKKGNCPTNKQNENDIHNSNNNAKIQPIELSSRAAAATATIEISSLEDDSNQNNNNNDYYDENDDGSMEMVWFIPVTTANDNNRKKEKEQHNINDINNNINNSIDEDTTNRSTDENENRVPSLSSSMSLSLIHLSESLRIAREQFGIASIVYATLDGILIYDRNRKGLLVQENCNKKDDGDNDGNNDDDDNDVNGDNDGDNNGTIDEEIAFALEELEEEGMTTTAIERLVQCRENMNNMAIVDEEIVTNNGTTKTITTMKEYDFANNEEGNKKKEELKTKKRKKKKRQVSGATGRCKDGFAR